MLDLGAVVKGYVRQFLLQQQPSQFLPSLREGHAAIYGLLPSADLLLYVAATHMSDEGDAALDVVQNVGVVLAHDAVHEKDEA